MKVAIVGSRDFDDYDLIEESIKELNFSVDEIVSGGAKGADFLAEQYTKFNNLSIKIFRPDWKIYGRGAGIVRNKLIVDYADFVLLFWDGKSKGTKSTINLCKKMEVDFKIVNF